MTSDNRWDEVEAGKTKPRTILTRRFKNEEERKDAISIDVIRAWRLDRYKRGLVSSLNDYFIDKDICPSCKGSGRGFLTREFCFRCAGNGRFFASEADGAGDLVNAAYNAGYNYAAGYHD